MAELFIYGFIGDDIDGVTDRSFQEQYNAVEKTEEIDLKIDSGGGSVWQGLTIYQTMVMHEGPVNVEVRGLAASMASVIAMAGDRIRMHQSSRFMIHNALGPSAIAFGTSKDLRDAAEETLRVADLLDNVTAAIVDVYAARTGVEKQQLRDWMDADTYLGAGESKKHGFADEVIQSKQLAARSVVIPRADAIQNVDELEKVAGLCQGLRLRARQKPVNRLPEMRRRQRQIEAEAGLPKNS